MSKRLKTTQAPEIHPDEITLIFPNNKPYTWRRDIDITIDPNDTENPYYDLYDDRVIDPVPNDTVQNIHDIGIGQPVTLTERDGHVFKIDGLGRIKAQRLANDLNKQEGKPEGLVPYVQSATKDSGELAELRVSLNMHRTDDDMLTKARLAQRLIIFFGWTPAQAANRFKVSITAIKNWLAMLDKCAPEVLKAVEKKKIAATTALDYAKLPMEEQAEVLRVDLETIEGRTQVRSTKEKKLSGSKTKNKEKTPEQIAEKRFQKVMDMLEEMSLEQRLRVFARFDVETGEEAPLVNLPEEEVSDNGILTPEGDSELKVEYDDETIDAPEKPTVKRRKRAGKSKK